MRTINLLSIFFALIVGVSAHAQTTYNVTFEWDASPTPEVSYSFYYNQGTNAQQVVNVGTNLMARLLLTNTTTAFVRALNAGGASDPSPSVTWIPKPVTNAPPTKPEPPGPIRVTVEVIVNIRQ